MRKAVFIVAVVWLAGTLTLPGQTTRTQTLALRQGWNAVFLEVYPVESEPGPLFANTPIDIVASYYGRSSSAQFVSDPSADLFKKAGWGVWYAENRPDSFLKTLHAINGQQGYLIHSKSDFTWTLTGAVVPPDVSWESGAFNFVGFSVHPMAAPTFAQFFRGSAAHRHNRIYRLVNGTWRRVNDPSAETMRSGEAFWIFCDGASRYQGPLRVEPPVRQGLVLGTGVGSLVLRNETDHPVAATVEHINTGPDPVPLSIVIGAIGETTSELTSVSAPKPAGAWTQALPALEAGVAMRIPLETRLQEMRTYAQGSLLKISSDVGTEVWIPVIGVRLDLKAEQ